MFGHFYFLNEVWGEARPEIRRRDCVLSTKLSPWKLGRLDF